MAGDWIRMRASLLLNPKVIAMADYLSKDKFFIDWWTSGTRKSCDETVTEIVTFSAVTRVTVASLLQFWSAANEVSRDGFLLHATSFVMDEMSGIPSFGDALIHVGWAIETDYPKGISLPNFLEYNTPLEKRDAQTGAQRTREWRRRKSCVTKCDESDAREEKRREYINNTPKPPKEDTSKQKQNKDFERFWEAFPRGRRTGKGTALKAWGKAVKKTDPEIIIQSAKEYADSPVGRGDYVKMPATWLNGECWNDDRSAWQRSENVKYKPVDLLDPLRDAYQKALEEEEGHEEN